MDPRRTGHDEAWPRISTLGWYVELPGPAGEMFRVALPDNPETGILAGRAQACLYLLRVLRAHRWPGNLRELDNVLRAAELLGIHRNTLAARLRVFGLAGEGTGR